MNPGTGGGGPESDPPLPWSAGGSCCFFRRRRVPDVVSSRLVLPEIALSPCGPPSGVKTGDLLRRLAAAASLIGASACFFRSSLDDELLLLLVPIASPKAELLVDLCSDELLVDFCSDNRRSGTRDSGDRYWRRSMASAVIAVAGTAATMGIGTAISYL